MTPPTNYKKPHLFCRFWQSFRGKPFPEVADAVQREVGEYKAKEEELSRLKVAMVTDNLAL